ncbi:uncharacterized protein LOC111631196 [Centruroides sculpturatus]|uniref:uncharacterized protein LOC111631196 n=1 Tax=Centruroides sculpturatus TaxID=218467 RepID=UPI000C6CF45F|nr:uncharacterized protein LOC111631196 [Centruroides sculpturatus]
MIGIWWLSIVVLLYGYSGGLMSFMACPLIEPYPRNFHELGTFVRNGEYSCGSTKRLNAWKDIEESKTENTKILRENILSNNNLMNPAEAMKKVQNERFAYIASQYVINQHISKLDKNKYIMSTDSLSTLIIAFPIRRNFPFKKDISNTVNRLFEAGIVHKLAPSEVEGLNEESVFQALSVEDIKSLLLFVGIGYFLSIIVLAIEIIYTKVTKTFTRNSLY